MRKKILELALITLIITISKWSFAIQNVKVAAIQLEAKFGEVSYNVTRLLRLSEQACRKGAKIIVLPEMGITGYSDGERRWTSRALIDKVAFTVPSKITKPFSRLSDRYNCYIVLGLVEKVYRNGNTHYYNSQVMFDKDGEILTTYRKINLYKDDNKWAEKGDISPQVINTEYGKLGLLICFDIHFYNPVNFLIDRGAQIILFSSAWDGENPIQNYWKNFAQNFEVYFIASNHANPGESCVIDDNGRVIDKLDRYDEGMVLVEIPVLKIE